MPNRYWFRSELFDIDPREELETNPGCYGKKLAFWLHAQLQGHGYDPEEPISEDWGWCLMCSRGDFLLWVGCGAMQLPYAGGDKPHHNDIVWHLFTEGEVPFWKFWVKMTKRLEIDHARSALDQAIARILASEQRIVLVEEP